MSELLFIAVPGGAVRPDGLAPLAVVVVPRLTGGARDLASHGMDRWPELLHSTQFTVSFRGHDDPQAITPLPGINPAEMLTHWQTMFPADTPVRPFETPPERDLEILDTTTHVKDIRTLYRQEVAGSPPQPPTVDTGEEWWVEPLPLLTARDVVPAEGRFARAAPPPRAARARARHTGGRPKPDFHERVAYLREHPNVLRALGLIVDFALAVPDDVTAVSVSGSLPTWPVEPAPTPRAASTICSVRRARFLPQPRADSGLVDGLVELGGARVLDPGDDTPDWAIVTFDVDAAMTRLASITDVAPTERVSLPGLRSAGLAVIRGGRRNELLDRTGRKDRARVHDTDLFAEDLVLGYRLDVRHLQAAWRSLCGRQATYTVGNRPLLETATITEESHVKADAMISDGNPDTPLTGDEIVMRWDGWSLGVPRPHPGRDRSPSSNSPLRWDFSADAPLPRLRFGTDYRLRARVADLAGGGLTVDDLTDDDPDDVQQTDTISYARVEPIPAPVVTYPAPREAELGAGLERLVIRSPGGPDREVGAARIEVRLLSPPPVSVDLADQHGVFDEHPFDSDASWDLARRAMTGVDDGNDPSADPVAGQPVGWLPDPLAAQWVLWNPDGGQRRSGRWAHAAAGADAPRTWTTAPVRLELKPGETFDWAENADVVTVSLGFGKQIELRLSSSPDESFRPEELLLQSWVEPASAGRVLDDVREGRHPHITPARTLHLVHAVERPLIAPVVPLKAERAPHDTFVLLTPDGAIALDQASTVQLDLAASWIEVGPRGDRTAKAAIIASETVPLRRDDGWAFAQKRQEFGDTRHRSIDYELTATSRFKEYFDLDGRPPGDFTTVGPRVAVEVPSSARPPEPDLRQTLPAFIWEGPAISPQWSQWKRTRRGGLLRVHMGPDWFHTGDGEQLAVIAAPQTFPPRALWGLLSQAGRDPIRETDNPRRWVTTDDLPAFGIAPVNVWVEEAQTELPVVGWGEPSWAPDIGADGGWIADIDLGPLAESSYCPFVRLAVARYQRESLEKLHLSPIVHTDTVQLLPTRELTVSHDFSTSVSARLDGLGPRRKTNRVHVELQRWSGPPDALAAQPQPDLITTAPVPDLPTWSSLGPAVTGALGDEITLTIEQPMLVDPAPPPRLLIREVEDVLTPPPAGGTPTDMLQERTVFVEAVPLWHWFPIDSPAGGE